MTLSFGARFDLLISFVQAKMSQHLKVPLSDSFSELLHTCLLPERVGSINWECLFVDYHNDRNVTCSKPRPPLPEPEEEVV